MGSGCLSPCIYVTQKFVGEKSRFLLTESPIQGGWNPSCSELTQLSKHRKPATPRKIKAQIRILLLLTSSPRWLLKGASSLQLQALCLLGPIVTIASQQHSLSPSQGLGCAARSLQLVMQGELHPQELPSSGLGVLLSAPGTALRAGQRKQSRTCVPRGPGPYHPKTWHPGVGPCPQELASNHAGPKPQAVLAAATPACTGQSKRELLSTFGL